MSFPEIDLQPIGPLWVQVVVFAATAAVFAYSLYATKHQPAKIRVLVGGLRGLLLGFALLLLHHPTMIRTIEEPSEQRMAVVIDRSGSMGVENEDKHSRYERAFSVLEKLDPQWKVEVLEIDQSVTEPLGANPGPRKLSGNKTDFYAGLNQLFSRTSDYASVVLLSDGHDLGRFSQMGGEESRAWLERLNVPPINTVLVGDHLSGPEIAIHSIDAPPFSFVRAPVRIRATVIVRNLDGLQTQVQLLDNDKIIQIKDLQLDEQGFGTVEFDYYPEEEGETLFTVMVPPHHLEANIENNRRQALIDIGRDKINVLHIAGSITWDLQGLRAMFERESLVDLTAFYIMRTREHLQQGVDNRGIPHDEMALVPFPTEEIFDRQLFGFDVVVFHDFDAGTYFSDSYQARRLMRKIREFVTEHRGGFVVVGGPRTAGGPSLGLTPLADIMPLTPPVHRVPYDESLLHPRVTERGELHPLLRFHDPETHNFFGSMQQLKVNKDADVLLEDKGGKPLLATAEMGNGRTLFLNTSSSWKWRREALKAGKTGESYYDFWEQVLKWAVQDPALNQVRLTTTKTVADPLALDVDVLLRDEDYKPADGVTTDILITPLDGREDVTTHTITTDGKGAAQVKLTVNRPGYYRVEPAAEPWRGLADAKTVFLGGSQDELRNLDLVPETLQRLSSLSGGRFSPSVNEFTAESPAWRRVEAATVVETQRLKMRNWLWSLPLLLLIAGLEWITRRSSHLA